MEKQEDIGGLLTTMLLFFNYSTRILSNLYMFFIDIMQPENDSEEPSLLEVGLNGKIHIISFFKDFYKIVIKECFRKCKMASRIHNT